MTILTANTYNGMDIEEFTELAYREGWSDGLPVLPPTERSVGVILDYLGRDRTEVIGSIPPSGEAATVEQVAINCAMAACGPEYVPVVIAAMEAMLESEFQLALVQSSAAGAAPCAIISGPVVHQLGFNYDRGVCSGNGSRANGTVGRAIALILWNIGSGRAGELSHPVFGHLGRYSHVLAERPPEDGNPWDQFHLSYAGLNSEDSAVTMFPSGRHEQFGTGSGLEQTYEDMVLKIARAFDRLGHMQEATQKLLVVNPLVARLFNEAGWSRQRLTDAIAERAKRKVGDLRRTCGRDVESQWWAELVDVNDDEALVPAVASREDLAILVSGGWPSPASPCLALDSAHGAMVTKRIEWDW
jgi:hypothetical protein